MKFRDDPKILLDYAERSGYPKPDEDIVSLSENIRIKREFNLNDIKQFADWKAPRIGIKIVRNEKQLIKDVSDFVFRSKHPKSKIEGLQIIHGVGYPLASTILHFLYPNDFAIIDVRALWSLDENRPNFYTYDFYERYNNTCKMLSRELNVYLRLVDKGLWQYSKENQK